MPDQRADVVIGGALEHCMLVDQTRRLADPHRHPQFLSLRDREVDVLHQNMHRRAIVERAVQHRIRHHRKGRPLRPLPALIAFTITSGSSPPLAPITKASDVAASETANRMLLVSFKTCAAPGLSPAMVNVW